MTSYEFIQKLPEGARIPSEEEFEIITVVYNYHPSIHPVEGKEQIAMLYSRFGMRIIFDMLPTAHKARDIEDEIRTQKAIISGLEKQLEELSMK